MFSFKRTLKTTAEYVDIVIVSCLHIGNACFDAARAEYLRNYILNTPNTYCIDLGDDTENALKSSKGDSAFRQVIPPSVQREQAVEFWKPIAKAKKLLLKHNSNHGFRSVEMADFSPDKYIADCLHVPYGNWDALSTYQVGKEKYVMHSVHGKKGGTTPEAALKACRAQAERAIADIYVRGHHHKCIHYSDIIKEMVNGQVVAKKRSFGVTGAFIGWDDSYAEMLEYPIANGQCLVVRLYANRHDHELFAI